MGFKKWITVFALPTVCCGLPLSADAQEQSPLPNIVLILSDDLGYGDLGCYGNTNVSTPNLDRLAQEGLRFTDFYANGSMCAPTRAALLTGRYQQRVGVPKIGGHLKDGEIVIARRLKEAGYATAMFGKWHVSGHHPDEKVVAEEMPIDYGFDEYRGLMGGFIDHVNHLDGRGELDWWHNREPVNQDGYASDVLTDYAVQFIREQAGQNPFFVYLALPDIHFPWMTPEDSGLYIPHHNHKNFDEEHNRLGPYDGTDRIQDVVHRMIQDTDDCTGRMIDTLKELGIAGQTLVFFTSDNGGIADYHGHNAGKLSDMGLLRGQKCQLYEGGIRVPAIAWQPGTITAGRTCSEPAATFDLFPTFLEMAGLTAPPAGSANALDGVSLFHLFQGKQTALPQRCLFWGFGDRLAAREGDWKLYRAGNKAPELYNLAADPGEQSDLARQYPERIDAMNRRLNEWNSEVTGAPDTPHMLELGEPLFSNRDYVIKNLPEIWNERPFFFSPFEKTDWTAPKAGAVYVFSQPAGERGSVEPELIRQGFEKTDAPEFTLWVDGSGDSKQCSVYRKDCRAGETVRFGRWGVLVFQKGYGE